MLAGYHIRYLQRQDIEIARWDGCVERAANRLIYGYGFYLDCITGGDWDALVLNDYEAVMPLTWRRKYGVRYLYQPAFTQQTGIFSPALVPASMIDAFLSVITGTFHFAEINFNFGNPHPAFEPRSNFILSLQAPYSFIAANYKKDLVRNLKLAMHADLHYAAGPGDIAATLQGYEKEYGGRSPHVRADDYRRFGDLCEYLLQNDRLITRSVSDKSGQLLATALLLQDDKRFYLLQSTTFAAGRRLKANHFLLNRLIQEMAGTGCTLDFEGSDLAGIAHFYANFGSQQQPYFFYRYNHLPLPWRWFKR